MIGHKACNSEFCCAGEGCPLSLSFLVFYTPHMWLHNINIYCQTLELQVSSFQTPLSNLLSSLFYSLSPASTISACHSFSPTTSHISVRMHWHQASHISSSQCKSGHIPFTFIKICEGAVYTKKMGMDLFFPKLQHVSNGMNVMKMFHSLLKVLSCQSAPLSLH